jgi:hypothetical protein
MTYKDRAIEICNNLTRTINEFNTHEGVRNDNLWESAKASRKELVKKRKSVMYKYKLKPIDIKNYEEIVQKKNNQN